jgi:hypothetical protein
MNRLWLLYMLMTMHLRNFWAPGKNNAIFNSEVFKPLPRFNPSYHLFVLLFFSLKNLTGYKETLIAVWTDMFVPFNKTLVISFR